METFGRYSGISDVTDAQRLALDLTNYKPPLLVETTDNGTWKWLGGSAWVQTRSGGAALMVYGALSVKVTTSGGYTYIGEASPGTAQATAAWRCQRVDSSGNVLWADGNSNFDNVATDLTALSYS